MPRLPLLLVAVLLASRTFAAEPVVLQGTEHLTLRSEKIGQTYDLFVSLPEGYAKSGKSYPVLYVLDGWHFPLMASLQNNNIYSERMPPVIMVNIGHGTGVNPMPLRARDFSPTHVKELAGISPPDWLKQTGGAAAFLEFIETKIIPLVDQTYRTVPTDRGLLGHSMGGLFALYTLVERPGLFQRIVAASPPAGWDGNHLFPLARERLQSLAAPVRLDLSAGNEGDLELQLLAETTAFAGLLGQIKPAKLDYRFTVYTGENHNSVRFASFPPGLYWVYRK
jgi:predicted alpha/beta superfamily hydrolase